MHGPGRLIACTFGALMLAACGQPAGGPSRAVPSANSDAVRPADPDTVVPAVQVAEEWLPRGINDIVWSSYIGLVGTVASTKDVDVTTPYMDYAEITLRVERVLYANQSWLDQVPKQGDEVQFSQFRPGDSTASVGGLPSDVTRADRYGPVLPVGTRLIVTLSKGPITTGSGKSVETLLPSHGYQSIWTAGPDGLAVSVQPSRTVGLDQLLAKVQLERERGRTDWNNPAAFAEDQLTVNNPLGGPPPTTMPTSPVTTFTVPTLPEVVSSPTDLTLSLDSRDGRVDVPFRQTAAGGIDIRVLVSGGLPTGVAAPTVASQEGKPLMVPLPSGAVAVALVGAPGMNADNVQVSIDGGGVQVASGTWNREGMRPVIVFIASKAPAHVEVLGLIPGPTLTFDLIPANHPEPPPISAPTEAGVTTTTADIGPLVPTTTTILPGR